ncbi:MAG: RNA pyrophosphohydrolase [Ruminobacter sp.]|nr:RNA pyrophosphohydrolase [Ruminobacter sp.]MDY5779633.1 RNA pyrophosphohydrolase [Succinivibrionaceae bacterium]
MRAFASRSNDDFVLDEEGYRPNVGIVIFNRQGQVLWARRVGQHSWQFPQGGINRGETPEEAMFRELKEELGLDSTDVSIVAVSKGWFKYRLPNRLIRPDENPVCVGQRQKWFLLRLNQDRENKIVFNSTKFPEFDDWRWVSYWYPVRQVVPFKKDVYRKVMREFMTYALQGYEDIKNYKNYKNNKNLKGSRGFNRPLRPRR